LLAKQTGLFLPTRAEVKIAGELSTHFPKRLSLPSSLPTAHPSRWPWRYLGLLTLVNLALRWSAIAHPSELVFDEVYYAQFGLNYLQGIPFFDVHPPLGKYLVAISIGLFYRLFPGDVPLATLTAEALNPLSYRWLNGVIGAIAPLLASWAAWEWSRGSRRRQLFTRLTGVLTSLDGFALVESRLALLHPALVAFGLAGLATWGRSRSARHAWVWRSLAGLCLGATMAVKWNGAGYGAALILVEGVLVWGRGRWGVREQREMGRWGDGGHRGVVDVARDWVGGMAIAGATYSLLWVPHLRLVQQNLWVTHSDVLVGHLALAAADQHPYQSLWYGWPLLLRPIAYFYEAVELRAGQAGAIALYGMGNPWLWWLAAAAVMGLTCQSLAPLMAKAFRVLGAVGLPAAQQDAQDARGLAWTRWSQGTGLRPSLSASQTRLPWSPIVALIPIAYFSLWLPWAVVPRSTFIYHYQSSALLAEMGLAWLMAGWIAAPKPSWRWAGWSLLGLMLMGFLFWLPLWMGWPLSLEALHQRWWLRSWI
jgi:dolichyl-phosphate-mannose-protein mannosyltransferase